MIFDLTACRRHIWRKPRRRHDTSMEVAIRAFRLTKRNLHVDSRPCTHDQTLAQLPWRVAQRPSIHGEKRPLIDAEESAGASTSVLRFTDNLHPHFSFSWPIKLTEKHSLPSSQCQLSTFHKNRLACPGQRCLRMRVCITLAVPIRSSLRHQPIKH